MALPDRLLDPAHGLLLEGLWLVLLRRKLPLCVHAEVAVQNDIKGFCGAESMMMHILSVLGIETLFSFELRVAVQLVFVAASDRSRGVSAVRTTPKSATASRHKYGLPDDEFLFSYTMTTYVCWPVKYSTCTSCAAYQMAYFMKYDAPNKQDLECCCYKVIC